MDGNEYIDYVGTWGPAILGPCPSQNHRRRAATPPSTDEFRHSESARSEDGETDLRSRSQRPEGAHEQFRHRGHDVAPSGSARGFTKRDKIIKFEGCYHGHADSLLVKAGCGALTFGNPDSAGVPAAFTQHTIVLPFNDVEAVRAAFAANPGKIAGSSSSRCRAMPVCICRNRATWNFCARSRGKRRAADFRRSDDRLSPGARRSAGALRHHAGPDLLLGKIIGGGLPVGAFGGRAEIMDFSRRSAGVPGGHASGNPLAMAAGMAQLRELDRIDGWKCSRALGQHSRRRMGA